MAAIEAIISMREVVSAVVSWEVVPDKAPAEAEDVPAEDPGNVPAEGPGNVPAESPVVEPAELSSTPTLEERTRRFFGAGPSPVFVDDFGLALEHVDALPFVSAAAFRAVFGLPLPDMLSTVEVIVRQYQAINIKSLSLAYKD